MESPLKAKISVLKKKLEGSRDIFLRAFVCGGLGLTFLALQDLQNYDSRLQIRPDRWEEVAKDFVLVNVTPPEWSRIQQFGAPALPLRDLSRISDDSLFWEKTLWTELLQTILEDDPLGVGVTFFFSPISIPDQEELLRNHPILQDPRVIWPAFLDPEGRARLPAFASQSAGNVGLLELQLDEDQVLRKFNSPLVSFPHQALKLAQLLEPEKIRPEQLRGSRRTIAFFSRSKSMTAVDAAKVVSGELPKGFFKNKTVLIGSQSHGSHIVSTPLGPLSRPQVIAQMTENIRRDRWITPLNFGASTLLLIALLALCIFVVLSYPQGFAFFTLLWIAIAMTALSIGIFDTFLISLPILSTLALILFTYMIFLNFKLTLKDHINWRLEEEKKGIFELEQLKTNFVSLISHDLKTPIAKIQAVCDRLSGESISPDVNEGLSTIRSESQELNRYIQSIIKMSRVESREIKINWDSADLNEIVENVQSQVLPLAQEKKIHLSTALEPLFLVEFDSLLISEVILNLVENSIKYCQEGDNIVISTEERDDWVYCVVEDTGPGIPPEDQERVFEKFYRVQSSALETKGSGLGLYLVRYFIELHGGEVFLTSQIGSGTRIGFRLPLTRS